MCRVKTCSKRQSKSVSAYYSSASPLRTSTDTTAAQEAMEKYTVEKVRILSHYHSCVARQMISNTLTGDRSPHQAHGPSQLAQHFTVYTNAVQFDERKGATWHCIVGRNFGSFVTHGKTRLGLTCDDSAEDMLTIIQRPSTSSTSTLATAPSCFSRRSSELLWAEFAGIDTCSSDLTYNAITKNRIQAALLPTEHLLSYLEK